MNRSISSICATAMVAFTFTACGGTADQSQKLPKAASSSELEGRSTTTTEMVPRFVWHIQRNFPVGVELEKAKSMVRKEKNLDDSLSLRLYSAKKVDATDDEMEAIKKPSPNPEMEAIKKLSSKEEMEGRKLYVGAQADAEKKAAEEMAAPTEREKELMAAVKKEDMAAPRKTSDRYSLEFEVTSEE